MSARHAWLLALSAGYGCGRISFDPAAAGDGGPHDAPAATSADGFFVEINVTTGGALGGLAGADARCNAVLRSATWLGKDTASSHGQVLTSNIHAWLCSTAACQNLIAGRRYFYASAVNPTRGGASFIATPAGFLEDDQRQYLDPVVFGDDDGFHEYFTGRADDNTPQAETCTDWASTAGQTLVAVSDTPFYPERLAKYPGQCTDNRWIICIVDPL